MIQIIFFLGFLSFSVAQIAPLCTATSVNITVAEVDNIVLIYTASFHIARLQGDPETYLIISDEHVDSVNSSAYHLTSDRLSIAIGGFNYSPCHVNINGYCGWAVGNHSIRMVLPTNVVPILDTPDIIDNLVDEGGISILSGELFTKDNNCQSTDTWAEFTDFQYTGTQCCITYKPVPAPPTGVPQCMQFNSSVDFHDNEGFVASFNAIFNMNDEGFNVSSIFKSRNNGKYMLIGNDLYQTCHGVFGYNPSCWIYVPRFDYKAVFKLNIDHLGTNNYFYTANIGKIIYRNNVYEKEEGVAYTQEAPCSFLQQTFSNNATATSQFCCTKFANN